MKVKRRWLTESRQQLRCVPKHLRFFYGSEMNHCVIWGFEIPLAGQRVHSLVINSGVGGVSKKNDIHSFLDFIFALFSFFFFVSSFLFFLLLLLGTSRFFPLTHTLSLTQKKSNTSHTFALAIGLQTPNRT